MLLASTEPSPSLPGRFCLCVVGAVATQWRLVERSDTKNDRVDLVTFDFGAAVRQQNRSLAELHYVQHGGKSCAPIVVTGGGFDDNRRSRTILVNACAAAHACAELCAFSRQFGTRCISDCLFLAPDVATVVSRNLVDRCSWLPQFPLHCRPRKLDIHSFIFWSCASCRRSQDQRWGHMVPSAACNRRRRPAENHPLRDCNERSEGLSLC